MKPLKQIEKHIRGWLPQEPTRANPKPLNHSYNFSVLKLIAVVVLVDAAVGAGLGTVVRFTGIASREPWSSVLMFCVIFVSTTAALMLALRHQNNFESGVCDAMSKRLIDQIRGWLPREVSMPARQKPVTHRFFPTRRAIVAYVVFIAGAALVGALLGVLGNVLGLASERGFDWILIISSIVIRFGRSLIYGRVYRREQQKEPKLREL
jgi:hypothetical protein